MKVESGKWKGKSKASPRDAPPTISLLHRILSKIVGGASRGEGILKKSLDTAYVGMAN